MPTLTPQAAAELFRRAPDRLLDVESGQVAYRRVGTGPDVLFVHGWPLSGATYRLLLPHLVDHVTCHVLDLPGGGQGRAGGRVPPSVAGHIAAVREVVGALRLDDVAVVGHDSGGLIARHALAGDPRVRAMGLIDTELPNAMTARFTSFVRSTRLPGFGAVLGWAAARPRVRRHPLVLGGAFADRSLLDGEFDEFFLRPLHADTELRRVALQVARSFDLRLVRELAALHPRITVPVQLVWGELDSFFPVARARAAVASFPDGRLTVVPGAGLLSHEERPAEVAAALLPVLAGT